MTTDALTINGPAVSWVSLCLRILNFFQHDFEPNINFIALLSQIDEKVRGLYTLTSACSLCIQNGGQRQIIRHLWMKESLDM